MSESTETLVATLRSVADEIPSFDGVANDVIRKAASRMEEQQARIAELEENGPVMQRFVSGVGTPWMGTMRQVLEDYKTAAATEAKLGDEARAECGQLRARVTELEQANSRVILDSSDHVPGATKMVTDRQLADAVNELRDIAIKYHSAGQLRERIAGVVRGLVRGGPAPVVDATNGLCGRCFGKGYEHGVYEKHTCPDCNGSGRLLAGGG